MTQALDGGEGAPDSADAAVAAGATRSPSPARSTGLIAAAAVMAGCLVVAWEARHSTFSGDDWSFILQRRGFSARVFLRPHNEHLSALPVAAYKLLLATFGASSYAPFISLLLVLHAVACVLIYVLARRYVGPSAALIPACVFVVLGPAWQDLLWAFQIGYLGSVAAGLGMLLCVERQTRRGDRAAAALLAVALLCSSVGLVMVALGAALIGLQRPVSWRRLWAIGLPLLGYLLWYAYYGVTTIRASNIPRLPRYVFDALSAALAAITGLGQTHVSPFLVSITYGHVVAVAVVGLGVVYLARGGRPPAVSVAVAVALVALWVAEGLEYFPGGREANQSRYQYPAAALLLLIACSVLGRRRLSRAGVAVVAAATLAVCASNLAILHQRAGFWSTSSAYDRAELGALDIARAVASPTFAPENPITIALAGNHNLTVVTAAPYFAAADAFGSPGDSPGQLRREPDEARAAADLVLAEAERIDPVPVRSLPSGCQGVASAFQGSAVEAKLTVANGGPASMHLELRRFASSYRFLRWAIAPGARIVVRWPRDGASVPWRFRLVSGGGARLCVGR